MFGILSTAVSTLVSLVFPVYASFKALATHDPGLMRPWLMYWVVFATGLSVENMCRPILQFVPLYGVLRMGTLVWLVLPQTQGAVHLYRNYVDPWLSSHERDIEGSIDRSIQYVKDSKLGSLYYLTQFTDSDSDSGSNPAGRAADGTSRSADTSITEALISRFRLPLTQDQLHSSVTGILSSLAAYTGSTLSSSGASPAKEALLGDERSKLIDSLSLIDRYRNERDHDGYDVVDTASVGAEDSNSSANSSGASAAGLRKRGFWK